jgi:CO/xanthine dehydrogenase Mo-binding subunit
VEKLPVARRSTRPVAAVPHSVGTSPPKLEAADKVTGRALYVDDLIVPGVLHGRTVRSNVARGRILKVVKDPAFDWSGVVIADHRDIPGKNLVALIENDQPLLAADEIRHADEPILLVAHEDPERAEAARQAIRVEVEPLAPVLTVEQSLAAETLLYGDDNVFKDILIERGDLAAEFAASEVVIEGTYRCGHQEQLYIENNGMIAERTADGGITVRGSLQCPYYVHKALMVSFGLPAERVRVIQTVTGGGFGGKEEYPSMIAGHAALLAWKSGRPVKIMYDRLEDIAATTKRHPAVIRIRAGVMRDGTLRAFDSDIVMDGGAYVTLSPVVLSRGAIHAAGPYHWPAARIRARAVATSTPPNGAFRGFGAPQTEFASECHMDRIADTLGLDPVAFRRRYAYREGDVTPTGQTLRESVGTLEVLDRTVKRSDWKQKRARFRRENAAALKTEHPPRGRAVAVSSRPGQANGHGGLHVTRHSAIAIGREGPARRVRRGIGLSLVYHGSGFTGSGEVRLDSVAALELAPDGRPRVLAASTEIGQGTNTVFAQFVADQLGVPAEFVHIEVPDTGLVPDSGPTVASRTVMVVGGLLERCAIELRGTLEAFAGRGVTGAADFRAVARRYLRRHGALRVDQRYRKPTDVEWSDETYKGDAYGVFSYAACVVEVEVDLDTFETRVTRVTTAQDIGKAIHPILAAGQIEGGTLQGLGWALLEEVRWKDGRVWNHQLTNYIIPTSADAPPIDVEIVEIPYSKGPQGAKGLGELPMDAPAPAVIAAIADAIGVRVDEIPVTPERLRAAWASHMGRAPAGETH